MASQDMWEQQPLDFGEPINGRTVSPFSAHADVYRRTAKEWGLPIGEHVRLRLADIDGDFEGDLRLGCFPVTIDRRNPLLLRIGRMTFYSGEIETCTRVAPTDQSGEAAL